MGARDLTVVVVGSDCLAGADGDPQAALLDVARHLAPLAEGERGLVVTHGARSWLEWSLLRSELAREALPEPPLDVVVADAQGGLGYQLQQALSSEFKLRGIDRSVTTVITRVEVDIGDRAFLRPATAVGPSYTADDAQARADAEGWDVADGGDRGWRRVVASPMPRRVVESDVMRTLLDAGYVLVAAGGGGIPVVVDERGYYMGSAAVLDEAFTGSLMASELGASTLLISCAEEGVSLGDGPVERMTSADLKKHLADKRLQGPALMAIEAFLAKGGRQAVLAPLPRLAEAFEGRAGTAFVA